MKPWPSSPKRRSGCRASAAPVAPCRQLLLRLHVSRSQLRGRRIPLVGPVASSYGRCPASVRKFRQVNSRSALKGYALWVSPRGVYQGTHAKGLHSWNFPQTSQVKELRTKGFLPAVFCNWPDSKSALSCEPAVRAEHHYSVRAGPQNLVCVLSLCSVHAEQQDSVRAEPHYPVRAEPLSRSC